MKDIKELSIIEIEKLLVQGVLTSVQLVEYYLERIDSYDKNGPKLNSILELNPDALKIAAELDRERLEKGPRSILHGIPILVKANVNTGDKMHTSAGSLALSDLIAPSDAFIVEKLRERGAIILGKNNMTEFANQMTFNMPEGYSSQGGQVINPYDKNISPGGSSSGSAVSVTSGLAAGSFGTETNGSIIHPARNNCVVGIKPTVGLVSRSGIIPLAHSYDTAGPMAKSVEDAAILLGSITGVDLSDEITLNSEGKYFDNYISFTNRSIKGKRIGICRDINKKLSKEETNALNDAISVLKTCGAQLIVVNLQYKESDYLTVTLYEFKSDITKYLNEVKGCTKIESLEDIIDYNLNHTDLCLKYGQDKLVLSNKTSGTLLEPKYQQALKENYKRTRDEGLGEVFEKYELDAFMTTEILDIAPISGYPCIGVPSGVPGIDSLVSMIFIGKPYTEDKLISIAWQYEQGTNKRKAPELGKI